MTKAVIGYLTDGNVRNEFMTSVLRCIQLGSTEVVDTVSVVSGPNLSRCRNKLVGGFLASFPHVPWLFMVDADMVFSRDTLDRLIDAADSAARPIVGAMCYQQADDTFDPVPTLFELVEGKDGPGLVRYTQWPENALFKVAATGTGCLLMHRTALENIAYRCGTRGTAWPWFKESALGTVPIGEDLTFCLRAAMAQIPIHVHTGIQVGHMKTTMLGKVT